MGGYGPRNNLLNPGELCCLGLSFTLSWCFFYSFKYMWWCGSTQSPLLVIHSAARCHTCSRREISVTVRSAISGRNYKTKNQKYSHTFFFHPSLSDLQNVIMAWADFQVCLQTPPPLFSFHFHTSALQTSSDSMQFIWINAAPNLFPLADYMTTN